MMKEFAKEINAADIIFDMSVHDLEIEFYITLILSVVPDQQSQ
jgi:hypothetical protein